MPDPDGAASRPDDDVAAPEDGLGRLARASAAARERGGDLERWVDQHRQRNVVLDLGMRFYERDREAGGTIAGSAVAFRLFLFFVPVLLVLVALAGFVSEYLSAADATDAAGVSGALAEEIGEAFAQGTTARWVVLGFGLIGIATSGRSLAKAFVVMSALAWRVSPRGHRAGVRITAAVVGIMMSLALLAIVVNIVVDRLGVVVAGASLVAIAVAYFVAWLLLALVLPRGTNDPGALLPGAALIGSAMALLQGFTQLYLPGRMEQASSLYGGLGVTIVTLGWFFIIGRLSVLSMIVNAVVYERLGSITTLVFSLPLLRAIPARSPRLAAFFGLEEPASTEPATSETASGETASSETASSGRRRRRR